LIPAVPALAACHVPSLGTHVFGKKWILPVAAICLAAAASPASAGLTTLASLDGVNGAGPEAGLTLSGGMLYGTTSYGGAYGNGGPTGYGTVFSLPITGGTPTVLASFNEANGAASYSGLIISDDMLYGTTVAGGKYGAGTVFSLPITGGTPTVLTSFYSGGVDGNSPEASLTISGGTLYGTTSYGGAYGTGTIFSLPITGGTPTVLTSFNGNFAKYPDPQCPFAGLTLSGNTLYGTTNSGGAYGYGEVFSLPVTGGTPTVLASFNGADSGGSFASLTLSGGMLYGTTNTRGAYGDGTVFSLPITGGQIKVLASFNGANGAGPTGSLIVSGSTLYGTTEIGGAYGYGYGTVFSLPVTGGTPTVLASFNGTNGIRPFSGVTLSGGMLYGTTFAGGAYGGSSGGYGTVFALAVPEPTSWAVLALAGMGLLLLRRRVTVHAYEFAAPQTTASDCRNAAAGIVTIDR
jgi:uncharacterized repeat protein (TIGR03803 family)